MRFPCLHVGDSSGPAGPHPDGEERASGAEVAAAGAPHGSDDRDSADRDSDGLGVLARRPDRDGPAAEPWYRTWGDWSVLWRRHALAHDGESLDAKTQRRA